MKQQMLQTSYDRKDLVYKQNNKRWQKHSESVSDYLNMQASQNEGESLLRGPIFQLEKSIVNDHAASLLKIPNESSTTVSPRFGKDFMEKNKAGLKLQSVINSSRDQVIYERVNPNPIIQNILI
jgi:hypothetical protein